MFYSRIEKNEDAEKEFARRADFWESVSTWNMPHTFVNYRAIAGEFTEILGTRAFVWVSISEDGTEAKKEMWSLTADHPLELDNIRSDGFGYFEAYDAIRAEGKNEEEAREIVAAQGKADVELWFGEALASL